MFAVHVVSVVAFEDRLKKFFEDMFTDKETPVFKQADDKIKDLMRQTTTTKATNYILEVLAKKVFALLFIGGRTSSM